LLIENAGCRESADEEAVRFTHGKKAGKPTIDDDEGFARSGYHLTEKRWSLKVALGLVLAVCINARVAVILWNTY
jgi:hypothetical protein